MIQRFQLIIHCTSTDDLAAILLAVEREVKDSPPAGIVGIVAEQVYTFDPTDDGG